jgi:hypothetical protein
MKQGQRGPSRLDRTTSSWDSGADESHEMVTSALIVKCTQEKIRLQAFPLSKTIGRNTESVSERLHLLKPSKEVRKG